MQSASSSKDTRLRLGVVMDALPKEKQTLWDNWTKRIQIIVRLFFLSFTLNPDLPDWSISAFIPATHHQLKVSELRHGEVHEVPAGDVDLAVDVACLPEHDLWNKKQMFYQQIR